MCESCDCARPIAPHFAYCTDAQQPDKCEWLDEAMCNAEPSCEATYLYPPCAPCDPENGMDCPACEPIFGGCHTRGQTCEPVLCDLWCEYGFQIDANGCEVCSCNPPPSGCWALDEMSCISDPGCEPIYVEGGCACAGCDPSTGEVCSPCDCPAPGPVYAGCQDVSACAAVLCAPGTVCQECPPNADCTVQCVPVNDRCSSLDEASCNATPECEAEYGHFNCLAAPCRPGPDGACENPCDPATGAFIGCHERAQECPPIPAIWCPYGNVIDPTTGCATGECAPNPECVGLDEQTCVSRMDCTAVYGEVSCLVPCAAGDVNCGCGATQFLECR